MRFLDYNGSGGLDSQDIATSIAVESSRDDEEDDAPNRGLWTNFGGGDASDSGFGANLVG